MKLFKGRFQPIGMIKARAAESTDEALGEAGSNQQRMTKERAAEFTEALQRQVSNQQRMTRTRAAEHPGQILQKQAAY